MPRIFPRTASSVRRIEFGLAVFLVLLILHDLAFFDAKDVSLTNILGYDLFGSVAKTLGWCFGTLERCQSPRLSHSNGATIPAR